MDRHPLYATTFLASATRHADTVCIVDGSWTSTYAEHRRRVVGLSNALPAQANGRPIAVLSHNDHRYLEIHHAALLGGGPIVPLNTRLNVDELARLIQDSGAGVLIVDEDHQHLIDDSGLDGFCPSTQVVGPDEYEQLVEAGGDDPPPPPAVDEVVTLMYTGGTTGRPKAAMLTQRNQLVNADNVDRALDFGSSRVHCHQAPMFHAAAMGQIHALFLNGARSIVLPRFDPHLLMEAAEAHSVDQTVMVPSAVAMLLDHPAFDAQRLRSLRDLIYGASPMPTALVRRLRAELPWVRLHQGYGMTESTQAISVLPDEDHAPELPQHRSAGRPLAGVDVSIRDEHGEEVGVDAVGEIWARGENFFVGYLGAPAETQDAMADGWFRTGDVGCFDHRGYLYVVDRSKDMIKSGGENVFSIEVEEVLAGHPAVVATAVVGLPDPLWGERVHAIVQCRPDATPTEQELTVHARRHLAAFKVPRSFRITHEDLPLSGAGKVLKRELRQTEIGLNAEPDRT